VLYNNEISDGERRVR